MGEFKREERYIVLKLSKISKSEARQIRDSIVDLGIENALTECVVVESDWPNYEDTWSDIEAVANGAYNRQESAEQRVKELEKFKLAVMQSMHHYDHELIGETGLIDNVSEFLGDDFSALNKFAIEQKIEVLEKFEQITGAVANHWCDKEQAGYFWMHSEVMTELKRLRAKGGEK